MPTPVVTMSILVISMMDIVDPDTVEPVTPAVFHILMALVAGASHGYGIMRESERLSGGRARIGNATLYRSIQKMAVDGLVEEFSDPAAAGDERRREYRLTPLGLRVARAEAKRIHLLVQVARRLGLLSEKRPARRSRVDSAASPRPRKSRSGDHR